MESIDLKSKWKSAIDFDGADIIVKDYAECQPIGVQGKVCKIYPYHKNFKDITKLISAAPELFEAAKYLVDVWDEVQGNWRNKPDHVQQKFLNAIKKATN